MQLLESQPVRRRTPGGFAASMLVHVLLIAGAVMATAGPRLPRERPAEQRLTIYVPPAPPPIARVLPAPATSAPTAPSAPVISVPISVPDKIPPIDLLRHAITDETTPAIFRVGPPSSGTPGIAPVPEGSPFAADQVEIPVVLDARSPLPRFPQLLKDAGVEGAVRFRFVVDTLGRVEMNSVERVEATHPLFASAVEVVLPKLRFTPARVGTHRVRQLVEFPLQFRITR